MSAVSSPCIKACRLDAQSFCMGCGRSLAEIGAWSRMTEEARLAIMERLSQQGRPIPEEQPGQNIPGMAA